MSMLENAIWGFANERLNSGLCLFDFRYGARDDRLRQELLNFFYQRSNVGDALRIFNVNEKCPY